MRPDPSIMDDELLERVKLTHNPPVCKECLYLVKLHLYPDEEKFYIGIGCNCGPQKRLSETYQDEASARMDLLTLSWKS